MIEALVAIRLVTLHMVDGRTVEVNPAAVQQLIHSLGHNRVIAPGARCLIRMGGNAISVLETCEEVQRLLEGDNP
jgi:hypothetical protein